MKVKGVGAGAAAVESTKVCVRGGRQRACTSSSLSLDAWARLGSSASYCSSSAAWLAAR